jgi:hypothetical protein
MVADTFGSDAMPRVARDVQRFGTIVVVGGGCYGGYYLRQLGRAARAGALVWTRLIVVDRDAACGVTRAGADQELPPFILEIATWEDFFTRYLDAAASEPDRHASDAVVPSPLMPHLMAGWLLDRARERWPQREVHAAPLESAPAVPWQRAGEDGTHYVSFAEWMCPINCIEPVRCPHTRGPRSWSLPVALGARAPIDTPREPIDAPLLFHCTHRAYGVGMIDVRAVIDADRTIAERGGNGAASFVVGTVSHCHGALRCIEIGAP